MGHVIESYLMKWGFCMLPGDSLFKDACVHEEMCAFDTMGVLPDWFCSPQHVAFFACSEGLFWVAHLLERSAISGADVSWEPFK